MPETTFPNPFKPMIDWVNTTFHNEFDWWNKLVGGVTNVTSFVNQTTHTITIWKVDEKPWQPANQIITIQPNRTVNQEFWIPWAKNQDEYVKHHMVIKVDGRDYAYAFQNGNKLYASTHDRFDSNAGEFPGLSMAGGSRKMVFTNMNNGELAFALLPV